MSTPFIRALTLRMVGRDAFSVGACPGCDDCGLDKEPSDHEYDLANEAHFSWSRCESCGSTFGGDRHPAHYLDTDRAIIHVRVCSDCLFFHANGDEPDDWRQHP